MAAAMSGAQEYCEQVDAVNSCSLEANSAAIIDVLASTPPTVVADFDPLLHYLPPFVPKPTWTALGNLVTAREKESVEAIHGSRWISLRLDGCGFSKAVKSLRRRGIFPVSPGYSSDFADAMVTCLRVLMKQTNAKVPIVYLKRTLALSCVCAARVCITLIS